MDVRFEKDKYHDSLQAGDRGNWPLDKEIVNYKFDNHCQKFYILQEKSKRVTVLFGDFHLNRLIFLLQVRK